MAIEETKEKSTEKAKGCGYVIFRVCSYLLYVVFFFVATMCTNHCARTNMRSALEERDNPNTQLAMNVKKLQSELPKQIDEVSIATGTELDDDYLYYIVELGRVENTILDLDKDNQKAMVIEMIKEKLPNIQGLIRKLIQTNRGLVYQYSCKTNHVSTSIILSVEELKSLIDEMESQSSKNINY